MSDARVILISIKPRFARIILDGSKRYELRRMAPRFAPGDRALIYASSPQRRVVGGFTVGQLAAGAPGEVWRAIGGPRSGLPEHGFFAYLAGAARCAAIEIVGPTRLDEPFELPFRPPQSYQFLRAALPAHAEVLERARALLAGASVRA